MDRQLAERMVGAACLLAVLVLVVPAILDGNPDSGATITHPAVEKDLDLRTHTIRLDGADRAPPVPMPVAGPAAPEPAAGETPGEAPPDSASPGDAPAVTTSGSGAPARSKELPVAASPARPPAASPAPVTTEATKVAPVEGAGDWIVQLGSFSSRANADRLAAEVRSKGFNVSVQGGGGSSGTLFRVRVGPEPDRAGAEALMARLTAAGFKGGRVGRK